MENNENISDLGSSESLSEGLSASESPEPIVNEEKNDLIEKVAGFIAKVDKKIEDKVYNFVSWINSPEKAAESFKLVTAWGVGINSSITLQASVLGNPEAAVMAGIWAFGLAGAHRYFSKAAERLREENK